MMFVEEETGLHGDHISGQSLLVADVDHVPSVSGPHDMYTGQWSPLHSTNNDKLILLIHILTAFLLSSSPNMHGVRDVDLSSLLGKHVLTEKYYFHQMVSLSG